MERIKDILRNFSTLSIVGIAVNIVVAVGLGIRARVMQLDGLYIALIVIGVLGIMMVLVNQSSAFYQRSKKPLYQQPNYYIASTLRDWLYKRGFALRVNNRKGFEFLFVAKDKQERPILIGKPDNQDEIMLEMHLSLTPDETQKLQKLNSRQQRILLSELRISLARHQVAYSGLKMPMKEIGVQKTLILDDSFTRDMFLDRVDRVRYSLILLLELLNPVLEREIKTETPLQTQMNG